ncbi:hypothetical protein [Ruegeria faecimaris]|uniref:hypothetical protein n=1 Tax=Ruegeria faecimaris TaxID=686389 RepID=UPI0024915018|nr:hypothetical protein [Ruegeria faecimaris]
MVKELEKPQWPIGKPLGHVRISGSELIHLLEKYESPETKISAETSRYRFDGVKDMKDNLPLLRGNTKIEISPEGIMQPSLVAKLGYCTTIRLRNFGSEKNEDLELLRQKIEAELKSFRTPVLWPFTIVPRFVWIGAMLGFWINDFFAGTDAETQPVSLGANFETALYVAFLLLVILEFVSPVYHSRSDTFWQRNKDKIIVGVIMLFVGVLATKYAPWFFGLFEK